VKRNRILTHRTGSGTEMALAFTMTGWSTRTRLSFAFVREKNADGAETAEAIAFLILVKDFIELDEQLGEGERDRELVWSCAVEACPAPDVWGADHEAPPITGLLA
jgi:hypothetical protein